MLLPLLGILDILAKDESNKIETLANLESSKL
jgi:hypothetical protein